MTSGPARPAGCKKLKQVVDYRVFTDTMLKFHRRWSIVSSTGRFVCSPLNGVACQTSN